MVIVASPVPSLWRRAARANPVGEGVRVCESVRVCEDVCGECEYV